MCRCCFGSARRWRSRTFSTRSLITSPGEDPERCPRLDRYRASNPATYLLPLAESGRADAEHAVDPDVPRFGEEIAREASAVEELLDADQTGSVKLFQAFSSGRWRSGRAGPQRSREARGRGRAKTSSHARAGRGRHGASHQRRPPPRRALCATSRRTWFFDAAGWCHYARSTRAGFCYRSPA